MDENVCTKAAENGHLKCLKYAHKNNCPWDKYTCINAAMNGHIKCLTYAHESKCPWDEDTCYKAAENGRFKTLKYAILNGFKYDIYKMLKIEIKGREIRKCVEYRKEL